MGTVFLASRADDQYRKAVAIKLIRRGMDTDSILSRFRHERQILASLDHPNIARLLEGGTTEDGLPYFVMEHIEGQPIDEFCDSRKLATVERLKLFRTVCSAVHYAHQNLIVHRDLKPGNILVNPEGTPKLLDFGIAKLLKPEMYAQTIAPTETMIRPMTPDYASPEQVRGQPVTTASDVYSLGVLLYELLTGHRPYRIKGSNPEEIERAICDQEPERPSTAITRKVETSSADGVTLVTLTPESVSRKRDSQPDRLRRKLAGDLDNIVLMAMRKEPQRRYASVEQFSEDLRRHIEGLPVIARKDTFAYRAGKFVKRHKVGVAAVAAFIVLTIAAAVAIVIQSARASRERDKAQKVSAFLVDIFKVSDPSEARGKTITAREILDKGAERIERELQDQPDVQATLMNTMGLVYRSLGLYDSAAPLLEKSLSVRRTLLGGEHVDVAKSLNDLGWIMVNKQNTGSAEPLLTEALAMRRKLLGHQHKDVAESISLLAQVRFQKGDFPSAEALNREALAMRRKLLGNEHRDVAQSLNNLGLVLHDKGDDDAAEPLMREALAIDRKLLGEEDTEVVLYLSNLALVKDAKGELDDAERLHRECTALQRKLLGSDHPSVATQLNNLAATLVERGSYEEALPLYREAIAIDRKALGEESWLVAQFRANAGRALQLKGDLAESESELRRALATFKKQLGDSHQRTARCMAALGQLLLDKRELAEAEQMLRQALDVQRKTYSQGHLLLATSCVALGNVLVARGNAQEAEGLLREGLQFRQSKLRSGHWQIAEAQSSLGYCLAALKRYDDAEPLLLESYATIKSLRNESDSLTRRALAHLINLYRVWGKPEKAAQYQLSS
jgi:eukaryotic-like serine/threonine-protein kinase